MANLAITDAIQEVSPGALIELYQLQLNTPQHGVNTTYYFHDGKNQLNNGTIIWNGQAYQAIPIELEGFEYNGQGTLPRPKLRISNIFGTITTLILTLPEGLEGAKVTRIRTLGRFLDAANFPARRNLYVYTEDFNATGWVATNVTMTANATLAPNGELTAEKISNTATTSVNHIVYRNYTAATTDPVTFSIYAKAAERDFIQLRFFNTGAFAGVTYAVGFNIRTGTIDYNNTPASVTATITDAGNDWFRCSISATPLTTGVVRAITYTASSATQIAYIETTGWGPYIWGAQLELGSAPSEYQPITGSTFTGNPAGTPDPTAEFPREIYTIDRKSAENRNVVEYELASSFDLAGVRAPKRQCITRCQWVYRSAECSYAGTNYFDESDMPVGNASQDVCGKRISSCEVRFGVNNVLPHGGFTGIGSYYA